MAIIADEILFSGLAEFGIEPTRKQIQNFHKYYQMMVEKNKVMNLTAITNYQEVVVKHWLDSLCILRVAMVIPEIRLLLENPKTKIIDVGTGAGFPGIPIKIMFPKVQLTLMDSLNKRIDFLQDVVDELELENVSCIHGRAEELGRNIMYREQFDLCVSRAVARLATLSEWCIPFTKVKGYFLPYKSGDAMDEINEAKTAIKELGADLNKNISYTVPESELKRIIPVIQKKTNTKDKYPRGGGKPLKLPILKTN